MRRFCRTLGVFMLCALIVQVVYYAVVISDRSRRANVTSVRHVSRTGNNYSARYGAIVDKKHSKKYANYENNKLSLRQKQHTVVDIQLQMRNDVEVSSRKNLKMSKIAHNLKMFRKLTGKSDFNEGLSEVKHIVFLKVHKAASTTIQTTLMRYGYTRNLSFVLPVNGHYLSNSTVGHKTLLSPKHGDHYDILCIHCFFNHSVVSAIMPKDSVYIAIVRDPLSQFISAFNYYRELFKFDYLMQIPPDNALHHLIKYPDMYEKSVLSYTMNSMARDFGFQSEHYKQYATGNTSSSAHSYLQTLDTIFDFVLVAEEMDESLILMKRLLKWKVKDILYKPKNVNNPNANINDELVKTFRERNRLDYLLYDHYLKKYQQRMKDEGLSLKVETANFKTILSRVQDWCDGSNKSSLVIEKTVWNEEIFVNEPLCEMLDIGEMHFISILKTDYKHK